MPSSATASLRIEKPATGELINTWGNHLDVDFDLIDSAIAGFTTVALTGDYTLTSANYAADEARSAMLSFTGTLAANVTVTIPSVSKAYLVQNLTNKLVTMTTGAGATVAIDPTDRVVVYCDGSGVLTPGYGAYDIKTYIAAMTASAGAVPGVTGNAGKYLYTDGVSAFWRQPSTADLSDYLTLVLGVQVALAVAL